MKGKEVCLCAAKSSSGRRSLEQNDIIEISQVSTPDARQQRCRERGGQQLPTASGNIQGSASLGHHDDIRQASTSIGGQQRSKKRDRAAKFGKRIAKGAGYAAAGTVAIIFFPITIGILVIKMRRLLVPARILFGVSRAMAPDSSHRGFNYSTESIWLDPHYNPYHSADIPAELPALHELSGDAPEMDLTSRLVSVGREYTGLNRTH